MILANFCSDSLFTTPAFAIISLCHRNLASIPHGGVGMSYKNVSPINLFIRSLKSTAQHFSDEETDIYNCLRRSHETEREGRRISGVSRVKTTFALWTSVFQTLVLSARTYLTTSFHASLLPLNVCGSLQFTSIEIEAGEIRSLRSYLLNIWLEFEPRLVWRHPPCCIASQNSLDLGLIGYLLDVIRWFN